MQLTWDNIGERYYETGVDHGVLYLPNAQGAYDNGVAWNGLTSVTESPSGAEANAQYADNIKYLNLFSAEEFGATIEAFTYPDEFAQFDGMATPKAGVVVGQQPRKSFGLSYRTRMGNDLDGEQHGYKLHLVYGCTASPSEKAYNTINASPEAIAFSWEVTTVPAPVTGMAPTSLITIDSTKVAPADLTALETVLYGSAGTNPSLPSPDEVIALFAGAQMATPAQPAFDQGTNTITIPTTMGVDYTVDNVVQAAGALVITENTLVVAKAKPGYYLKPGIDVDWYYTFV